MSAPRYSVHPSPVGEILIVTGGAGILMLRPFDGPLGAELERTAMALRGFPQHDETAAAEDARAQLDEYFDGDRRTFDLPLDWQLVRGFTHEALLSVIDIPYGETASYGEVAAMAGRPRAARSVGTSCATTPFSVVVPVHRVVRADGTLGEYGGRPEVKRFLIDLERETLGAAAFEG